MNIACPECKTVYRLDPSSVPEAGARTRCRSCGAGFRVRHERAALAPGVVMAGQPETAAASTPAPGSRAKAGSERSRSGGGAPAFGRQDPETRARRLARALVSDIKIYHPDKWKESRKAGTLRQEFRTEILKSWEEYVEQVGEEMAKGTPFFRDALNEILAEGKSLF